MAATLFYLARHPLALQKVADEIRNKFWDVEQITQGPLLNECIYLRACIDEAMRLSPSVGGLLPREVLPGGITIDGESIPAGTIVGTPHYSIHHSETYYPSPFSFVPERWLSGSINPLSAKVVTHDDVEVASSAFCPFSIGPRGCIGKELAYGEMRIALARLLFLYDMRTAVGIVDPGEGKKGAVYGRHREGEFQLVDTFTSIKNGPLLEFRKR